MVREALPIGEELRRSLLRHRPDARAGDHRRRGLPVVRHDRDGRIRRARRRGVDIGPGGNDLPRAAGRRGRRRLAGAAAGPRRSGPRDDGRPDSRGHGRDRPRRRGESGARTRLAESGETGRPHPPPRGGVSPRGPAPAARDPALARSAAALRDGRFRGGAGLAAAPVRRRRDGRRDRPRRRAPGARPDSQRERSGSRRRVRAARNLGPRISRPPGPAAGARSVLFDVDRRPRPRRHDRRGIRRRFRRDAGGGARRRDSRSSFTSSR